MYILLIKVPYRLIAEVVFKTRNKMETLAQGQEKTQHEGFVKRPLKIIKPENIRYSSWQQYSGQVRRQLESID